MDAALRRQLLQTLADRFPSAVLAVGPRDEVLLCTEAARRLLGQPDRVPRRLSGFPPGPAAALAQLAARARAAAGELRGEELFLDDGAPFPLRADALPLAGGEAPGAVMLLLRDDQAQLTACADVLAEVSHELRTPLTSLQSTLQLVAAGEAGALNDDQRRFVDMGVRAAGRMGRLVDGLLDLAQQQRGRLALLRRGTPLPPLLVPLLEQLRVLADSAQRTLVWDIDPRACAHVHPDRWLEIVENLVGNAIKYTPRAGRIRVALRGDVPATDAGLRRLGPLIEAEPHGALLTVADDGPGLPTPRRAADQLALERADPAPQIRGWGLGLSITQALVRAHDGRIDMSSRAGRGTTVRVWTPGSEPVARLIGMVARVQSALQRGRQGRAHTRPHGTVWVGEQVSELSAGAAQQLERWMRDAGARARWLGALAPGLGVAVVDAPALGAGRPGAHAPRRWAPGVLAAVERHAWPGRWGSACAPADGVDAGTLLAVALTRAREPLAAAAHQPDPHAPKEERRG